MVSTKKICKSGQSMYSVYSLLVISRNHFNIFLLIDLQKTKLFKVKYRKVGRVSSIIRNFTKLNLLKL